MPSHAISNHATVAHVLCAAGLAPHWDDVEIFVVQTQGSKRWRLYAPPAPPADAGAADAESARARLLASSHLANQVSGDLLESEIGQPTMEFTLEVSTGLGAGGRAMAAWHGMAQPCASMAWWHDTSDGMAWCGAAH